MRFLLVGDHPDGLAAARAVVDSERHTLAFYSGPATGVHFLQRWGVSPKVIADFESALANPNVDAVIIAGRTGDRPAQLRRAMQSEHHVLCVHPIDQGPDTAYEVGMIQGDTGKILMPLLPEASHPAVEKIAEWIRERKPQKRTANSTFRIDIDRHETEHVLLETTTPGRKPNFPGWQTLRTLGGEIIEVFGYAEHEEPDPTRPVFLTGRFKGSGLFRSMLLPHQPERQLKIVAACDSESIRLTFPQGFPGPCELLSVNRFGEEKLDTWETWNPWPGMIAMFERAVSSRKKRPTQSMSSMPSTDQAKNGKTASSAIREGSPAVVKEMPQQSSNVASRRRLTWEDAVRSLELDDATRRSIERRRASTLDFQEVSEDVTFKGTMTLVGCGLLWGSVALLICSIWLPWVGWTVVPLFGIFLVLQLLRWVGAAKTDDKSTPSDDRQSSQPVAGD